MTERVAPERRRRCRVVTATAATTAVILFGGAGAESAESAGAGTPERGTDPLASAAMRSYLAVRRGSITAAVEDLRTGQTWVDNPDARDETASIVKVDILQTLLRQAEVRHRPLDGADPGVIAGMIENSDNGDASTLWRRRRGHHLAHVSPDLGRAETGDRTDARRRPVLPRPGSGGDEAGTRRKAADVMRPASSGGK